MMRRVGVYAPIGVVPRGILSSSLAKKQGMEFFCFTVKLQITVYEYYFASPVGFCESGKNLAGSLFAF